MNKWVIHDWMGLEFKDLVSVSCNSKTTLSLCPGDLAWSYGYVSYMIANAVWLQTQQKMAGPQVRGYSTPEATNIPLHFCLPRDIRSGKPLTINTSALLHASQRFTARELFLPLGLSPYWFCSLGEMEVLSKYQMFRMSLVLTVLTTVTYGRPTYTLEVPR